MEKQLAIIVGAGAIATAVLGGLGWKAKKVIQENKKQSTEQMELRKAELWARVNARKAAEQSPIHVEMAAANVLAEIVQQPVIEVVEEPAVDEDQVVRDILTAEPPKDVLRVIEGGKGTPILSVARARVPEIVQPDQAPMFWSAFVAKSRRPEVIEMSSKDFETRNEELARGYHKCTVDGVPGILHVTKSNVSAVIHMGGDEFNGISTSASRFNGKGLVNLNHEQAKNFLSGR